MSLVPYANGVFSEKHEFNPPDNQAQKIKTSRPDTPRFKHIKGPWVAEKFPGQFPKVCDFLWQHICFFD